jgi:hypothetical protein
MCKKSGRFPKLAISSTRIDVRIGPTSKRNGIFGSELRKARKKNIYMKRNTGKLSGEGFEVPMLQS